MSIKYLHGILFFFFLFLLSSAYAYTVSSITIEESYVSCLDNTLVGGLSVSGILSNTSSIVDNKLLLTIYSNADNQGIDFNADVDGNNFSASFSVELNGNTRIDSYDNPVIAVNGTDTVTIADDINESMYDTIKVDSVAPDLSSSTIDNIISLDSIGEYDYYYAQDANIDFSAATDSGSYIDHYILYLVDVGAEDDYQTEYNYKSETDSNSLTIVSLDTTDVDDGNYYLLVDAEDAAGNDGNIDDVLSNKQLFYVDNTDPSVSYSNLGALEDSEVYYVDSNDFYVQIKMSDSSSGIDEINTDLDIILPTLAVVHADYNSDYNGFNYHLYSADWGDGNIFQATLDAYDNVENSSNIDFNIIIDSVGPTIPTDINLNIDSDSNVTAVWTASTDSGSGIQNYKLYRSTSNFSTISGQTLICTTLSSVLTCEDTTSKSFDESYYYGVVAVDKAGNISDVITSSVTTGPELDIDVNGGEDYTNDNTPDINVTYSSDVNQIRFSCNNSSYTSWITVTGTSYLYSSFNIGTSSYGCSTAGGDKTVYVQAMSEDEPYLISTDYAEIYYDTNAPEIPVGVVADSMSNGSIRLTWNSSDDNGSGIYVYRIYYSTTDNVTTTANYFTTSNTTYTYSPNMDQNYYFKIAALDKAGNLSSLSLTVMGQAKRYGPTFTFDIESSIVDENVVKLKGGLTTITITSDEELLQTPIVQLKIDNGNYATLFGVSYSDKVTTLDYNFSVNGTVTLKITGENLANEDATDTYSFTVDANSPIYDINYSVDDATFNFVLSGLSTDVFRVQYLLNGTDEMCVLEDVNNFGCSYDSSVVADGNYIVHILAYDRVLNLTEKTITISIDNVDEIKESATALKNDLNKSIDIISNKIQTYDVLLIVIDNSVIEKFEIAKDKYTSANVLFTQNDYSLARTMYLDVNNLITEIQDALPKEEVIKSRSFSMILDGNHLTDISSMTTDANVVAATMNLYKSNGVSYDRNFIVQEISGVKYYSMIIEFKNDSNLSQTITIVDYIPKDFADSASDLIFNKQVEVIASDPIIMYTMTIPAKSSETLRYKRKTPATDFEVVTKFDNISFDNLILLSGNVTVDLINIKMPVNFNTLLYVGLVFIGLIVVLIVLGIVSARKNRMPNVPVGEDDAKNTINEFLGKKEVSSNLVDVADKGSNVKSQGLTSTDQYGFKSSYDYIMTAVKRDNRDSK